MEFKKTANAITILFFVASLSSVAQVTTIKGRQELKDVNTAFLQVVAALAVLLIAVNALRYVTSDNPQERADIKKSLTYVILGLLITYLAGKLVEAVYCYSLEKVWGVTSGECKTYI
jgi:undecaprenyl pyrophosphate phosphatase UppP